MNIEALQDRIYHAIADYSYIHGTTQEMLILPKKDYKALMKYARSTKLGRSFIKCGFRYCQLEVFSYKGKKIIIA